VLFFVGGAEVPIRTNREMSRRRNLLITRLNKCGQRENDKKLRHESPRAFNGLTPIFTSPRAPSRIWRRQLRQARSSMKKGRL
jgi:hypothetical protein